MPMRVRRERGYRSAGCCGAGRREVGLPWHPWLTPGYPVPARRTTPTPPDTPRRYVDRTGPGFLGGRITLSSCREVRASASTRGSAAYHEATLAGLIAHVVEAIDRFR